LFLVLYLIPPTYLTQQTTNTGLKVRATLDEGQYPTGIQVTDEQVNSIQIERNTFHGEWNYKVRPSQPR
jgi:hypothetical protein